MRTLRQVLGRLDLQLNEPRSRVVEASEDAFDLPGFRIVHRQSRTFLDKWNMEDNESEDGVLTELTGKGNTSGTFCFDDVGNSNYLIVLKFGSVFSAFLSTVVADDWGWDTDPDKDGKHENSHLTLYGSGITSVPTPLPLALIGIGLVALFVTARARGDHDPDRRAGITPYTPFGQ